MVNLVLRPSGITEAQGKPWALQLRWHDLGGTDYQTLCRVSDHTASEIMEAGAPYWLFGEPKWDARAVAGKREAARALLAEVSRMEGTTAPDGWDPIETAPTEAVGAFDAPCLVGIVEYADGQRHVGPISWEGASGGWVFAGVSEDFTRRPSHWKSFQDL